MASPRASDREACRWFHIRVQDALRARGWSARELARRAGCDPSVLTRLGQGSDPGLATAVAIAGALGIPLGDMTAPVDCMTCHGVPPAGFTCNTCGREGKPGDE